jgi:hypothetical protein
VHRRLVDIRLWIGSDDQVQADLISSNYIATARAYCFDLAATAFLFVSASVVAGRIWRFPFDDELATLSKIEPEAAREFVTNFSHQRRHSSAVRRILTVDYYQ